MDTTTALIVFAGITLFAMATEIMYTYATRGLAFGFSSNRAVVEKTGLARRIERAYLNQTESAAYIVPALAAASLLDVQTAGIGIAAALIVFGRAGFIATYYTGVSFIRVPFFVCGSFGSLYVVFSVLMHTAA